jgi:hypothetical protein
MAIIQISKQQQRSGNLVDLPQLSEAEFGWASDDKRLFIGKETPNENIEVLTSYSQIDFSQIEGAVGNLNISNITAANGQILAYDGSNWVNRGGSANGFISLGNVSNVQITGGAINYILTTDGLGNLSWTPKGALYTNILGLSNADPIVMTVANTTPYVNDAQVTISGVLGVSNNIVNGESFYVQLAGDFATSGNVSLYTSSGAVGPVDGTGLTYTNSPNAIATSTVGGSGSGGLVGGTTNSVQYNDGSGFAGSASFTWNDGTSLLTITGNANVGNLNATGTVTASRLVSNITTGTAPLTVSSTTKVANLNADLLDGYDTSVAFSPTTVVVRDVSGNVIANSVHTNRMFNGTSNVAMITNGNVSITVASNEIIRASSSGAEVTGNLLITGVFTGNGSSLSALNGSNITTGTVAAARVATLNQNTTGSAATVTTAAQPNITSVGTLTDLTVTGDVLIGTTINTPIAGFRRLVINEPLTSGVRAAIISLRVNNTELGTIGAVDVGTTALQIATPDNLQLQTGGITRLSINSTGNVSITENLSVTGNITSANVTTSSYVIRSVGTAISAAGTIQGDATALTKDINVISTVSAGQGVRLPAAVAGMVIIVNNASATNMNVYPATGAAINSLATNAAYTHVAGASLQYYAVSSTQWYTVGATYS